MDADLPPPVLLRDDPFTAGLNFECDLNDDDFLRAEFEHIIPAVLASGVKEQQGVSAASFTCSLKELVNCSSEKLYEIIGEKNLGVYFLKKYINAPNPILQQCGSSDTQNFYKLIMLPNDKDGVTGVFTNTRENIRIRSLRKNDERQQRSVVPEIKLKALEGYNMLRDAVATLMVDLEITYVPWHRVQSYWGEKYATSLNKEECTARFGRSSFLKARDDSNNPIFSMNFDVQMGQKDGLFDIRLREDAQPKFTSEELDKYRTAAKENTALNEQFKAEKKAEEERRFDYESGFTNANDRGRTGGTASSDTKIGSFPSFGLDVKQTQPTPPAERRTPQWDVPTPTTTPHPTQNHQTYEPPVTQHDRRPNNTQTMAPPKRGGDGYFGEDNDDNYTEVEMTDVDDSVAGEYTDDSDSSSEQQPKVKKTIKKRVLRASIQPPNDSSVTTPELHINTHQPAAIPQQIYVPVGGPSNRNPWEDTTETEVSPHASPRPSVPVSAPGSVNQQQSDPYYQQAQPQYQQPMNSQTTYNSGAQQYQQHGVPGQDSGYPHAQYHPSMFQNQQNGYMPMQGSHFSTQQNPYYAGPPQPPLPQPDISRPPPNTANNYPQPQQHLQYGQEGNQMARAGHNSSLPPLASQAHTISSQRSISPSPSVQSTKSRRGNPNLTSAKLIEQQRLQQQSRASPDVNGSSSNYRNRGPAAMGSSIFQSAQSAFSTVPQAVEFYENGILKISRAVQTDEDAIFLMMDELGYVPRDERARESPKQRDVRNWVENVSPTAKINYTLEDETRDVLISLVRGHQRFDKAIMVSNLSALMANHFGHPIDPQQNFSESWIEFISRKCAKHIKTHFISEENYLLKYMD